MGSMAMLENFRLQSHLFRYIMYPHSVGMVRQVPDGWEAAAGRRSLLRDAISASTVRTISWIFEMYLPSHG